MKRFVAILLLIASLVSLTGCSYLEKRLDKENPGNTAENATGNTQIGEEEEKNTNDWGILIDCDHQPSRYRESKNDIACQCRANVYRSADLPDLDYNQFYEYMRATDFILKNKEKHATECFLKFKGVNAAFFTVLHKVDVDNGYEETLTKIENLAGVMEDLNLGSTVMTNLIANADIVEEKAEFDDVFGTSLTVVQYLVDLHRMLDQKEDPYKACNEFIETVKGPVGMLPTADGVYLTVALNSLQTVLSAYQVGVETYMDNIEYTALALNKEDGAMIHQWESIKEGKHYWEKHLTYEHIMGTAKVEGLKLPALSEIVKEYKNLSQNAKAFAGEYILYCVDYLFKDAMGISYQQYIKYLCA